MPTIEASRKKIAQEDIRTTQISENEWAVYNHAKGTLYSVMYAKSGFWHCSCPYMTRSTMVFHNGVCKHITLVLDEMERKK